MQGLGDKPLRHLRPIRVCGVNEVDAQDSTARRSTASASAGSLGSPQMPLPVIRIAPNPMRTTGLDRRPSVNVPDAAALRVHYAGCHKLDSFMFRSKFPAMISPYSRDVPVDMSRRRA